MNFQHIARRIADRMMTLEVRAFYYYYYAAIGGLFFIVFFLHYIIYMQSIELSSTVKRLQTMAKQSVAMVREFEILQHQEARILELLEKNKDLHLKIYFEQLCKEKNLNIFLVGIWSVTTRVIDDQLYEESLKATFKNMTTEQLVKILEDLEKQPLLYVKALSIRPDKDKKIVFDITLATIKNK